MPSSACSRRTRQATCSTVGQHFEPSENPKSDLRHLTRIAQPPRGASSTSSPACVRAEEPQLSADRASVERPRRIIDRCAQSHSSSAQHSLRCGLPQRPAAQSRRGWLGVRLEGRTAHPPLSTRLQSRGSARARSSSKAHMRWERDPTHSRSQRHPSLDRATTRPRHSTFRPTRATAHEQPLDLVTTPTRVAVCAIVGPHLRHHRRRSHAGTAGHSRQTPREARACTRPLEVSCRTPRAQAPRPATAPAEAEIPSCRPCRIDSREPAQELAQRSVRSRTVEPNR